MVLTHALVTGATGMVGRHVVAALDAAGVRVSTLTRRPPAALPVSGETHLWDLADPAAFPDLDDAGIDGVVHAGACVPGATPVPPREIFDANVSGTLRLGSWAADRGIAVVYLSGAVVYADDAPAPVEETQPTSPRGFGGFYRTTKLLGEQVLAGLDGLDGRLTVLRPTSIYGAGLGADKLVAKFLAAAGRDEALRLSPPWDDRIGLVHAADVASAVIGALRVEASGVYNVPGTLETVAGIAEACVAVAGAGRVDRAAGAGVARAASTRFDVDGRLADAVLGYRPAIALRTGIAMMRDGILLAPPGRRNARAG